MSGTILDTLAASTRRRIEAQKREVSPEKMKERAQARAEAEYAQAGKFTFPFEHALRKPELSYICEVKCASPSKGRIAQDFDPVAIAKEYEQAGASAISCLTEPEYFLGSDEYLSDIVQAVSIPALRKDFIVDSYMIYQAKVLGAQAVLLIVSLLNDEQLKSFIDLAHSLGLSALVEAYEPEEIPRAIAQGARVVGVNNRDLKTFTVDFSRSTKLRSEVPDDLLFVSESGVQTRRDIYALERAHVDAVLIGETLMRQENKRKALNSLKGIEELTDRQRQAKDFIGNVHNRCCIKLCGMKRKQDIDEAVQARPDFVGFIVDVPSSKRNLSIDEMSELCSYLVEREREADHGTEAPDEGEPRESREGPHPIFRVAVLVNEGLEQACEIARHVDVIQLHGQEDGVYIDELKRRTGGIPVIQAFKIHALADAKRAVQSTADMVLADAGAGSGTQFDWRLLKPLQEAKRPFMLAGGLNPENVSSAIKAVHPWGIDMSSGIETDGVKDPQKMWQAVEQVKSTTSEYAQD